MNFILVIADTVRRDRLGCYGTTWMHTPHLDRFAARSIVFDNAFIGSFPTVPNRREVLTGRYVFTYAGWAPLPLEEIVLQQVLGEAGYLTMMIVDTPHILRDGYHFDRDFTAWQWIRGQENDRLHTDPHDVDLPAAPQKLREPERTLKQHLRNISRRQDEEDWFCAQTMIAAANWLKRNHRAQPFFLYVDTFDPHEPWDAPKRYEDLYDRDYRGDKVTYPAYGFWESFLTPRELEHCHALYCAEVTLVDTWVGHLLATIEELGLLENTAVAFTSDHGFYFGEHGVIGKALIDRRRGFRILPLFEEVARIPLIAHIPGVPGGRQISALVQPVDLMPTFLELAGVRDPGTLHGQSLMPLLRGEADKLRDFAVSSYSISHFPFPASKRVQEALQMRLPTTNGPARLPSGQPSTVTTDEWSLVYFPADTASVPTVTADVDGILRPVEAEPGMGSQLYHRLRDPGQTRNVIAEYPQVALKLHAEYVRFLEQVGTASEIVESRNRLVI